jgi:hypothetical protein
VSDLITARKAAGTLSVVRAIIALCLPIVEMGCSIKEGIQSSLPCIGRPTICDEEQYGPQDGPALGSQTIYVATDDD